MRDLPLPTLPIAEIRATEVTSPQRSGGSRR
jgi:hypothetical protein